MRTFARLGMRARVTVVATALVAVGLTVGALVLVGAVRVALLRSVDDAARQRARDVGALVDRGQLSDPVPVVGGTAVVQVLDQQGRVLAVSPGADRLTPLVDGADLAAVRAGRPQEVDGARMGISDRLRVVAVVAGPRDARRTVLVGVSLSQLADSLRVAGLTALVGAPLLTAASAATVWWVTGSVIGPVAQRQRTFVADAAHELRSPLAAVRTQLEVGLHHPEATDWPDTAHGVLEDVGRMSRLVDDLLLLARAPTTARGGTVDLRDVARGAATRPAGRVPVTVDEPDAEVLVHGDPDALARVVANLVDNAVRHAGSKVSIEVRPEGDEVVLVVADDGPGIAPEDRQRVFERFTRLDEARSRDAGGSGLGLPIVRELLRSQAGSISLADGAPGLRAVVHLPRAR